MQDGYSERLQQPDIVLIPSTQGKLFMIDAEDEERVRARKWSAANINGWWYAVCGVNRKLVYLHRFIMNAPKGLVVDHANGDTFCCCKWNLRVVTVKENATNRKKRAGGYTGVSRSGSKWAARIKCYGVVEALGSFDTPEEAARAYDAASIRLNGECGRRLRNFPDTNGP